MKILITGGSGLLGQYLNIFLSRGNEILSLYNKNVGNCNEYKSVKINIVKYKELSELFTKFKPDVVIHTAGFTRPEQCNEENKELVYKTNVQTTKMISILCEKYKSKLIYTSTDLVFDGNQGDMIKENGILNPISIYAQTKLKAEQEIIETFDNFIILRTSLLIGLGLNHSWNNFHSMYKLLSEGKRPKLFSDQYRTPLSLINASEILVEMCNSDIKTEIFNFAGLERVSRVELGNLLCKLGGFDKNLIESIKMSDLTDFVQVADVSLNTDKLRSYGFFQKTLDESVKEIIK